MNPNLYLVVMYDRHRDDEYSLHHTIEDARAAAKQYCDGYGKAYEWSLVDTPMGEIDDYWESGDDGPTVRIVPMTLERQP